MGTSEMRISGATRIRGDEEDRKMQPKKHTTEPVAEVQKRNGDVSKISNPK